MFGLFISFTIAVVNAARGKPWPEAYQRATGFLFWWYIIVGALATLIWMVLTGILTGLIGFFGGPLAALLATGISAVWFTAAIGFLVLLQVIGALCLRNALTPDAGNHSGYRFSSGLAAIGCILLFIGLWNFST